MLVIKDLHSDISDQFWLFYGYKYIVENRAKKNRSLVNNAGSFWGVQSKFNFNGNKDYIGKVLMTDVHFGQQLPLGNHFVFRYHVGLGYAKNFDYQYTSLYPALNVAFGYHFQILIEYLVKTQNENQ